MFRRGPMKLFRKFPLLFFNKLSQLLAVVVAAIFLVLAFFPAHFPKVITLLYALVVYPLHTAVTYDFKPAVHVLSFTPFLNQKMEIMKGGCVTPLEMAIRDRNEEIIKILEARGAHDACN